MIHRNTTHPDDNGLPDEKCPTCDLYSVVKAYRVTIEGQSCIIFDTHHFKAVDVAIKAFRERYSCQKYPISHCERAPEYDKLVTQPGHALSGHALDEKSLREATPKRALHE